MSPQQLNSSTVLCLLRLLFHFMMHQMFSAGERSGLRAGQSGTEATMKPCCCNNCSMWFCWNTQGLPWKRRSVGGRMYSFKICMYLSALMVSFQMHELPIPLEQMLLSTITDPGFRTECWSQAGWSLSWPEERWSMFSKNNFQFQFGWPQNSFPLYLSPF